MHMTSTTSAPITRLAATRPAVRPTTSIGGSVAISVARSVLGPVESEKNSSSLLLAPLY